MNSLSSWVSGFFNRPSLIWRSAALTHEGCVRKLNEDNFLNQADRQLWAVADGMGGHEAGEVASQAIVDALAQIGSAPKLHAMVGSISASLGSVNTDLQKRAQKIAPDAIIGAATVTMVARDDRAVCQWAGDARLYRLRNGMFEQLTTDHDLLTEMKTQDAPPELLESVMGRNAITRAIGANETLQLDQISFTVQANDSFLLCSDGLYREVSEPVMSGYLREGDLQRAVNLLVESALNAGGRDNVTAIVMRASSIS